MEKGETGCLSCDSPGDSRVLARSPGRMAEADPGNALRSLLLVPIVFALLCRAAFADGPSALLMVGMVALFLLNGVIGAGEGLLIAYAFRLSKRRMALLMVAIIAHLTANATHGSL